MSAGGPGGVLEVDVFEHLLVPEPVIVVPGTTGILIRGRARLFGWMLNETTGAGAATLTIADTDATGGGTTLGPIDLAAGESDRAWFGPQGVRMTIGVFVTATAGNVGGCLFVAAAGARQ